MTATVATQLDLFGTVLAAEQQRKVDALTCLRDAVPTALEVITELRYQQPHDTRDPHYSRYWVYCVSRAGLRFDAAQEFGRGGHHSPARLLTWDELTTLVGQDPRRAEVAAWAESLPMPRWKHLMRPHELWPDPQSWHISYFCGDHLDMNWTARRRAWQLVLDLLTDAIDRLETSR